MTIEEFALTFGYCFVCQCEGRLSRKSVLHVHHIVRGSYRQHGAKDHAAAWIRTCDRCHDTRLDGGDVTWQLAVKALCDPENYDRVQVNRMRHRADDAISEHDVVLEMSAIFRRLA